VARVVDADKAGLAAQCTARLLPRRRRARAGTLRSNLPIELTGTEMAISYVCDEAIGLSVTVAEGILTAEDWRAHVLRQMADPAWPAGRASLTDATRVRVSEQARAIGDDIASLYAPKKDRTQRMRFAIVAHFAFADARSFEGAVEPHGTRPIVFNDLPTACVWLGVDQDRAGALIEELRNSMRPHL
jgi:hypothetical protein